MGDQARDARAAHPAAAPLQRRLGQRECAVAPEPRRPGPPVRQGPYAAPGDRRVPPGDHRPAQALRRQGCSGRGALARRPGGRGGRPVAGASARPPRDAQGAAVDRLHRPGGRPRRGPALLGQGRRDGPLPDGSAGDVRDAAAVRRRGADRRGVGRGSLARPAPARAGGARGRNPADAGGRRPGRRAGKLLAGGGQSAAAPQRARPPEPVDGHGRLPGWPAGLLARQSVRGGRCAGQHGRARLAGRAVLVRYPERSQPAHLLRRLRFLDGTVLASGSGAVGR